MKDIQRVSGVFTDTRNAERAVQQLLSAHFEPEEILLVETGEDGTSHEVGVQRRIFDWRVGAVGGVAGIVVGAVLGVLIAVNVLPGSLFSTDPAVLMVQAIIGGFGAGALAGYVMGLAMWDARARFSKQTRSVRVGVDVGKKRMDVVRRLLEAAGADETSIAAAA
jgi:hypothetical protein